MRDNYFFQITNSKKYFYTIFANLILLTNFIFFALFQYNKFKNNASDSLFVCIIIPLSILLFFFIRFYFIIKHKKNIFTNLHFAIVASILWCSISLWIPAILVFLFGIFEFLVNRNFICTINNIGIHINSLPSKHFKWNEIDNLLMKDGFFTMDLKNNKLFQLDVSEEVIPFKEEDFNQFASQFLKK